MLAAAFLLPVAAGILRPFSRQKIQYSLGTILDNVEFLAAMPVSIYLTKKIFFERDNEVFRQIYSWIPDGIKNLLYGKDILIYITVVPVILIVLLLILRLFTTPFYNAVVAPLSDKIYSKVNSGGSLLKRIIGALWQLPRAVYISLILALLLNFCTYYFYSPTLAKWMNDSVPYQFIYKKALYPVLNSNIAKEIPVLLNDSFSSLRRSAQVKNAPVGEQAAGGLAGGDMRVIRYFNGVTLDEAVKSTPEIDETAKKIAGREIDSRNKAYLLYKWVSKNIEYDFDKAARISTDPKGIPSGSIVAFSTRKGICFDYSSLYVSMCRAVGLRVRLVTGLGYSGVSWGDHAWNQVYSVEESRWIDVDATFGNSGADYFDKEDFNVDHKYPTVQGEW